MYTIQETKDNEIYLDNISHCYFDDFLNYLKTQKIQLTQENFRQILTFSEFFGVYVLYEMSMKYLIEHYSKNILEFQKDIDQVFHKRLHRVLKKELDFLIEIESDCIFKSKDFMLLSQDIIIQFLKHPKFYLKEENIYSYLIEWSKHQLHKDTSSNLIEIFKKFVPYIKFPLMSSEFLYDIKNDGVLTIDYYLHLLEHNLDDRYMIKDKKETYRARGDPPMLFLWEKECEEFEYPYGRKSVRRITWMKKDHGIYGTRCFKDGIHYWEYIIDSTKTIYRDQCFYGIKANKTSPNNESISITLIRTGINVMIEDPHYIKGIDRNIIGILLDFNQRLVIFYLNKKLVGKGCLSKYESYYPYIYDISPSNISTVSISF